MPASPTQSRTSPTSLLRQFRLGLHQQMYYLGMDVMHPQGNLLIQEGFIKLPSPKLKATSCYHLTRHDGSRIELHGSSIAWVPPEPPGIIFLRGPRRMRLWNSPAPFTPGDKDNPHLGKTVPSRLFQLSKHIAGWWLDYEERLRERHDRSYREQGFDNFRRVPKATSWKPPGEDLAWLREYLAQL